MLPHLFQTCMWLTLASFLCISEILLSQSVGIHLVFGYVPSICCAKDNDRVWGERILHLCLNSFSKFFTLSNYAAAFKFHRILHIFLLHSSWFATVVCWLLYCQLSPAWCRPGTSSFEWLIGWLIASVSAVQIITTYCLCLCCFVICFVLLFCRKNWSCWSSSKLTTSITYHISWTMKHIRLYIQLQLVFIMLRVNLSSFIIIMSFVA